MPLVSRKPKSRFFPQMPHVGIAPKWLQPERLNRREVTDRSWEKDRLKLDLDRPLPLGSATPEELRRLEPGLFHAWNRVQQVWEVWCRREGGQRPPYFVTRVVSHPPNVTDDFGQVIKSCSGRPYRSRKATSCPPSCSGEYQIPDRRIIQWLWKASLKNVSAREQADAMDRMDEVALLAKDRAFNNFTEACVSHNLNRLLGIKQVGYTGKEK